MPKLWWRQLARREHLLSPPSRGLASAQRFVVEPRRRTRPSPRVRVPPSPATNTMVVIHVKFGQEDEVRAPAPP